MCPFTHTDGWTTENWNQNTPGKEIHQRDDTRVLIDVENGSVNIQVDQQPLEEIHTTKLKSGHVMIFGNANGSIIH